MPPAVLEKATLVRCAAARKTLAGRLFRTRGLKFFVAPFDGLMASGEWKA
jgi:hypothetical protein